MMSAMNEQDRSRLNFENAVREKFSFLSNFGFAEVEALPTLMVFRMGEVDVDIYHGRHSYEIGGGISGGGVRYAMSEIVRISDPEAAIAYRNPIATSKEAIADGLEELSALMQRYGTAPLQGNSDFFRLLGEQRKYWAEGYAAEVIEEQLRPLAEEAFRKGNYSKAAELYSRIRQRLSPAELKKLEFSRKHRGVLPR